MFVHFNTIGRYKNKPGFCKNPGLSTTDRAKSRRRRFGGGSDPTDALTLALSLRTLALTLQAIIAQMRLSSLHPRSSDAKDRSICQLIQILGHSRFARARRADTS